MSEVNSRDLAAMAAAEGALAAESVHCPDWSSHRAAWFPGGSRRAGLAVGLVGYGAIPAGLLAAGILAHSAAFAVLAWAILLVTAAGAPLLRGPLSDSQRGKTPRSTEEFGTTTMRELHDQGA